MALKSLTRANFQKAADETSNRSDLFVEVKLIQLGHVNFIFTVGKLADFTGKHTQGFMPFVTDLLQNTWFKL